MADQYHLIINLLDRRSPNSSRSILAGFRSTLSSLRALHPTPTGLPGQLDSQIANTPSYFPSDHSNGFWLDLTTSPTTRLGERWDSLEDHSPIISQTTRWYEPQASTTSYPNQHFSPAPTLDYRFGPISLDWVDNPASHPAFFSSPQMGKLNQKKKKKKENNNNNNNNNSSQHHNRSGQSQQHQQSVSPTLSSPPSPSSEKLPTGRFVPNQVETQGRYQLGSTDFGYGSIHLYRDFDEASSSFDQPQIQKHSEPASHQSDSNNTDIEALDQGAVKDCEDPEGMVIGVLAIPSYMTSQVESVESVRMLRDALPNRCIGLIKFRTRKAADSFALEFNGKPFSHLQDREICHTAHIRSIRFKSSLIPPFTFPALLPPDLITKVAHELPTCPVCLERMDSSVTGLMTNTCSHTFHCHCLSNWGDSRCPICRYSQSKLFRSSHPDQSECAACGSQANLWICLICGHVGCGRYQGGHAHRHFEESSHLYALELGSQRVWDYVSDNYVHRLIQTKSDQIVELPALSSAVFDGRGGPGTNEAAHQSKIEAISEEFGHLVASQLDSQRAFYEEEIDVFKSRIEKAHLETELQRSRAEEFRNQVQRLEKISEGFEVERQRERERMSRKSDKALELSKRFESELKEEKMMTEGMRVQLRAIEEERAREKQKSAKLEAEVADLKDQVRDLMFFLEAQSKIQNEGGEELKGGSIEIKNNNNLDHHRDTSFKIS
ncbi:hypothetical protein BY996DRAFT_6430791 [Phakopsora pachyrhizi]|nr:hypothetical protein BY996DRAFT_6430791 [Phakopsora pachyrhizi]